MDDELRPYEWLEHHGPRDAREAREAAIAVQRARIKADELAALDALTPFERALAERAYRAGAAAAITLVESMMGHAAELVRADVIRHALAHVGDLNFRRRQFTDGDMWTTPENVRAAQLVAGAHQQADLEARGPEGGDQP